MPTIHYKIITDKYESPSYSYQCSNFSSMIKNKISGYVYVNSYSNKVYKCDLISAVSKNSCIPYNTIVDIYIYSRTYIDENKNYTPAFNDWNERSIYVYDFLTYYAYVELSRDSVFYNINNTQKNEEYNKKCLQNEVKDLNSTINRLNNKNYQTERRIEDLVGENKDILSKNQELKNNIENLERKYNNLQSSNDRKIENLNNANYQLKRKLEEEKNEMNKTNQKLERNIQSLEEQNKNIRNQYENLKTENQTNKYQLDNLTVQHNNLKKKQEEEENKKMEKKKNLENYKITFRKDKEEIEIKNIKESKSYINKFIINEFVKGFNKNSSNKDQFTKNVSENMTKFTNEFMKDCEPFIISFKKNSQKIISEYQVNKTAIKIDLINFIVIGQAGIGKSSFINESLLLEGNNRAKEGKGTSVTDKSTLYCSEKLKMIRMWDTQGLDYKVNQSYILNEIKRLVDEGLKKGPDHYINIILYCIKGDRFQEEDGQLIKEIMQLYPMDNLPVIISQLQAYFENDAIVMENTIREILKNFLEDKIVKKIEITSIVSRDKEVGNITYKSRGIPELLRSSFDVMGRAITSATYKKFLDDIEHLCKNFVDIKINYLKQQSKDEMEVFEISKDYYLDNSDKYFEKEEKPKRVLSNDNFYSQKTEKAFFINNFVKIMTRKFIDIYNNLNNTHYSLEDKERPGFLIIIQERLEKMREKLIKCSQFTFEKFIYEKIYQKYFTDLRKQQSKRSKEFNTTNQIIDEIEIEKNFKKELFEYFQNEFFKYFFCIIIKLFMDNLENILIEKYQKELKENEAMTKIINEKAENSLKLVTRQLKEKLLKDLEKYFPKKKENETNEFNDIKNNFNFDLI